MLLLPEKALQSSIMPQAGEEGGATPAKDPASEASTTLCSTAFSQLLDSIDLEACANTRDSLYSNASTDEEGMLSARQSPRDHGALASAGQDDGKPDAAQRPPSAENFPFQGPIPPGWRSDAVLSLDNKLHREIVLQLLKVVINTQGSKRTAPATEIKLPTKISSSRPRGKRRCGSSSTTRICSCSPAWSSGSQQPGSILLVRFPRAW